MSVCERVCARVSFECECAELVRGVQVTLCATCRNIEPPTYPIRVGTSAIPADPWIISGNLSFGHEPGIRSGHPQARARILGKPKESPSYKESPQYKGAKESKEARFE